MKVTEILGIDAVRFAEPEFGAQTDSLFNGVLAAAGGDEGRLLVDGDGEPIAIAFHGPDGWLAASFLFRNPTAGLIEQFENMNGEILQEDRPVFTAAVREYYSTILMQRKSRPLSKISTRSGAGSSVHLLRNSGAGAITGSALTAAAARAWVRRCSGTSGTFPISYDNDASLF